VTCLDVHKRSPGYIVAGHEKGQLVLYDALESKKPVIKTISKCHQGIPVTNVKFADWAGEKGDKEDEQWMFVSADVQGTVCVTTVSRIMFYVKSKKQFLFKGDGSPCFSSIACRFP